MSNAVSRIDQRESAGELMEQVVIEGNLDRLAPDDRVRYYNSVCNSLGLNPLTKPFDYIKLNGKLTLYAKRDATDQLRKLYGVSIRITDRAHLDGVYVVTAQAILSNGRQDEATGAVSTGGLKGESLANALMKAETKAKRRVTLSICGLGLLDETELEHVSDDAPYTPPSDAFASFADQIAEAADEESLMKIGEGIASGQEWTHSERAGLKARFSAKLRELREAAK